MYKCLIGVKGEVIDMGYQTKSQCPHPPEGWRSSQSVALPQWGTQLPV